MSNIYRSSDELCSLYTLQLIALANAAQELVNKKIEVTDEKYLAGFTLEEKVKEYTALAVKYNYSAEYEEKDTMKLESGISNEILLLIKAQSEVDILTIDYYFNAAKTYMSFFWEDLYAFKKMNLIPVYMGTAQRYNAFVMAEYSDKKVNNLLASGKRLEAILAPISVEDETLIILSSIVFPVSIQESMIETYEKENMIEDKKENYEEYMLEKLTKQ